MSATTFLEKIGWSTSEDDSRGEYASVDESEDLPGRADFESLRRQHERLQKAHRELRRSLRGTWIGFAVVFVALVGVATWASKAGSKGGVLTPVPEMPTAAVKFTRNDTFAGPSTPSNDEAWSAMMPAGDGFILVDTPEQYNLPAGKATQHGQVYDISAFHQLHCLAHIRNHYYLTQLSLHSNNSERIEGFLLRPQEDHVRHCFDYLRQGIMCAGDMTLEWPRTEADGDRFAVDGWGVTHQCKDWDAIMTFMRENDVASKVWT